MGARSHRIDDALLCYMPRAASPAALSTAAGGARAGCDPHPAPCPHARHHAAPHRDPLHLGMARRLARRGAGVRSARDAIRPRAPRHRHRGARWVSGARPAGRGRAIRRTGRGSPGRVDRARRRAGVELRARRATGGSRRDGRAGTADRRAAERPRARLVAAAPGRETRRRLHRSARTARRRATRAAAQGRGETRARAPPSDQARGCAVR